MLDFGENSDNSDNSKNTDSSDFLGGANKETLRDYLQNRIRSKDPLLVEKSEKLYKAPYSRTCPTVNKRQPVILTDEEKSYIDTHHPGTYGKSLQYNTKGNPTLHYICPKYWCVDENISLADKDVNNDGKILKSELCKDSSGNYGSILEFNHKLNHYDKKTKDYIYGAPAVGDKSCIPCCFKKQNTANKINPNCISREMSDKSPELPVKQDKSLEMIDLEEKANSKDSIKSSVSEEKIPSKLSVPDEKSIKDEVLVIKEDVKLYNYIQQSNKFPLETNKWGHIPEQVENILNIKNVNCDNGFCILRYGIEQNKNQSFLNAIASVYNLNVLIHLEESPLGEKFNEPSDKRSRSLSIDKFKQYLLNSLSLDIFYELQNGNLIDIFSTKKNVSLEKPEYKENKIYKKLYNKKDNKTLQLIINSYENFKSYIKSKKNIDYTYLWDLIYRPNPKLFHNGINIIILEILGTDSLNNIKIICPTNYYSQVKFNESFTNCILIKYGEYYEPLYRLYDSQNNRKTLVIFNYNDVQLHDFFVNIKYIYEEKDKCLPFSLIENDEIYKSYTSIKLSSILNKYNIDILSQVIDIYGKVIGLVVKVDTSVIQFLPCFPSNILKSYDIIFSSDFIFNTYEKTSQNLDKLNSDTSNELKCMFGKKVIEKIKKKTYIVGILTELNLFVPIDNVIEDKDDGTLFEKNRYVYIDKSLKLHNVNNNEIIISSEITKGLVDMESLFYNRFKIIVRENLNKNKMLQSRIFDIIKSVELSYTEKQKQIYVELNSLIDNVILFTEDNSILECFKKANTFTDKKEDCFKKKNKQLLPTNNLLTKKNNKIIYLLKLIDEMIRTQQGLYFFEVSNKYFSYINNFQFETHNNEIIVSQSELNDLYSEKRKINKNFYEQNTSFGYANPIIKNNISNKINYKKLNKTRKIYKKEVEEKLQINQEKKMKRPRCPKGTRRNRKTGVCEEIKK